MLNGAITLAFLLTRPLRGVTKAAVDRWNRRIISTHTPLARRDELKLLQRAGEINFYSHAPCEA